MDLQMKSSAECGKWLQRVHEVQIARMTPERREELRMKAKRSQATEVARRQVKAVKSHAVRSKALMHEGLRQMECASAPDEFAAVQSRWNAAQKASSARQETSLQKMAVLEEAQAPLAMVLRVEDEEEEEAEGMAEAAALVGLAEPAALARAPGPESCSAGEDEFEKLLNQLKIEPTNDEEMAAKFGIYGTYSEEVSKMRATLFGLYEENKASLPDAVKADMERQLKRIDREEAMGIPEHIRVWFVYHMMRQAGVNNESMGGIMERFEKKLEFLANNDQDECPICLEELSSDRPSTILGCCHKVCSECWDHWVTVMHGHPFCPLCKNEEFVEALQARVSTPMDAAA